MMPTVTPQQQNLPASLFSNQRRDLICLKDAIVNPKIVNLTRPRLIRIEAPANDVILILADYEAARVYT